MASSLPRSWKKPISHGRVKPAERNIFARTSTGSPKKDAVATLSTGGIEGAELTTDNEASGGV